VVNRLLLPPGFLHSIAVCSNCGWCYGRCAGILPVSLLSWQLKSQLLHRRITCRSVPLLAKNRFNGAIRHSQVAGSFTPPIVPPLLVAYTQRIVAQHGNRHVPTRSVQGWTLLFFTPPLELPHCLGRSLASVHGCEAVVGGEWLGHIAKTRMLLTRRLRQARGHISPSITAVLA
jgi:hypothetical protein